MHGSSVTYVHIYREGGTWQLRGWSPVSSKEAGRNLQSREMGWQLMLVVCGPVHLREGGLSCKDRNTCGILGETRQKGERKQKALHGQTPALSVPSDGSVRQVQD